MPRLARWTLEYGAYEAKRGGVVWAVGWQGAQDVKAP